METARQSESVRLSPAEKHLLESASRRDDAPWSSWMREVALRAAVDALEDDHPDLTDEPSGSRRRARERGEDSAT